MSIRKAPSSHDIPVSDAQQHQCRKVLDMLANILDAPIVILTNVTNEIATTICTNSTAEQSTHTCPPEIMERIQDVYRRRETCIDSIPLIAASPHTHTASWKYYGFPIYGMDNGFVSVLSILTQSDRPFTDVQQTLISVSIESLKQHISVLSFHEISLQCKLDTSIQCPQMEELYNLLRHIQHISKIGDWQLDLSTYTGIWSEGALDIFGYSSAYREHTFQDFINRIHPDDTEYVLSRLKQLPAQGECQELESRIIRTDQTLRYIRIQAEGIYTNDGQITGLFGIVQDITGSKHQELELKASRDRFQQIIEDLGDDYLIYRHTVDGTIISTSSGSNAVFGIEPDEFVGKNILIDVHWAPDANTDVGKFEKSIEAGFQITGMKRSFHHPDGTTHIVKISSHTVHDSNGTVQYVDGIIQDITKESHLAYAIRRSDTQLREAQRIARLGNWEVNLKTMKHSWSDETYRIFGLEPQEVEPSLELLKAYVHPDDREEFEGQEPLPVRPTHEFRIILPNQEIRYLRAISETMKDDDGKYDIVFGTIQDITHRKRSEQALQESEERFNLVLSATEEGIWDYKWNNGYTYYSPQWKRLLGYQPDELDDSYEIFLHILHPDDRDKIVQLFTGFETNDVVRFEFECRMKHKDGTWRYFITRGLNLRNTDGALIRTLGTTRDITKKKHITEQLKIFQLFADQAGQGFGMATLDGELIYMNKTLIKLLKANSLSEVNARGIHIYDQNNREIDLVYDILPLLSENNNWKSETIMHALDGTTSHTIESFYLIRDEKGAPLYIANVITPIDDLKAKEAQLREAQNEAEKANQAKSEFLANMSHEIRTPLNGIMGMSRLVQDTNMTSRQRHYMMNIDRSAKALRDLIGNVLDLSRIEAGKLDIEIQEFNLEQLIEQIVELFSFEASDKNIEFIADIEAGLPNIIKGDPLRISQILTNFIGNAIKFTDSGEVVVTVRILQQRSESIDVQFFVEDTGIGIPEDQQEKLFQPFTQADGSITRRFGGSGLGLAISKQLIELMGGTLELRSEERKGSTFSFTLSFPISADNTVSELKATPEVIERKILLVDDNPRVGRIIQRQLRNMGFVADMIDGAASVTKMLRQDPAMGVVYDLFIIDLDLSGTTGIELVKHLRNMEYRLPPMLLLSTSFWQEQLSERAIDAGFSSIITKPVLPKPLFNAIMNIFMPESATQNNANLPVTVEKKTGLCGIVLLVEDNEINQELVTEFLRQFDLKVLHAWNGAEAIEVVRNQTIDLILMDIQMPQMDGLVTTQYIRNMDIETANSIPIIAMTAHALRGDRERCIAAGMNGYIAKPIDPNELHSTLQHWLPASSSSDSNQQPSQQTFTETNWIKTLEEHGIHAKEALSQIRGNTRFYLKMLDRFNSEYAPYPEQIAQLLTEGKNEEAHIQTHSLKNISGYIGATSMWQSLIELEDALKYNSDHIVKHLETFANEMTSLVAIIRNVLRMIDDSSPS